MEWWELASTYEPLNPQSLSAYERFRMLLDDNRTYVIFVYLLIVYYLGFATRIRMPILKTLLLYALIFVGALIFSILDATLPIKAALFTAIVILVIVRLRNKPDSNRK